MVNKDQIGSYLRHPISAKQLTHGEAMVFAFAFATLSKSSEEYLTGNEMALLPSISSRVTNKLHLILTGEMADESDESLPGLSFLRHCGTPLADRYFKEMGDAMSNAFGEQTYASKGF